MSIGTWRVATRLAARNAWRAKGRTVLVVALVGLPVMGASMADTLFRTAELTAAQEVDRTVGRADYLVGVPIVEAPQPGDAPPDHGWATELVDQLAADGATVTSMHSGWADVAVDQWTTNAVEVEQLDLDSPVYAERVRLLEGRVPGATDEVVLTDAMLRGIEAALGDVVRIGDHDVRVVGTAVLPSFTEAWTVFPAAETVLEPALFKRAWLIDPAPGADVAIFESGLRDAGLEVLSRQSLIWEAELRAEHELDPAVVGTAVVVVGLAMLQVVLLAGVAFTVGARRQRRELGLIAVQGGSRADRRAMVLASGLVVGVGASVVGALAGVALAWWLAGPVEDFGDAYLGPFEVAPVDLLVIVALGTATAPIAAALPARAASRVAPLDALAGRRTPGRAPVRLTAFGLAGVVVGAVIAALGAKAPASFNQILAGAVIAELGFVFCTPALIGLVGRGAKWLPLAPRLGLRDAVRNRGRSAPAVAAIMAAVAATVGLATFGTSDEQRAEEQYSWVLPEDVVLVRSDAGHAPDADHDIAARVAAELPEATLHQVSTLSSSCRPDEWGELCFNTTLRLPARADAPSEWEYLGVAVGGPEVVEALLGRPDTRAAELLSDGQALVLGQPSAEGELQWTDEDQVTQHSRSINVQGVPARTYPGLPQVILPSSMVTDLDLNRGRVEQLIRTSGKPTASELDAATEAARQADPSAWLWYDRGPGTDWPLVLLGLVVASLVVTLGASTIVTALSKAEAEPDLATLAAVGASPAVRRRLAAAQAGTVAALGAGLGIPTGLIPVIAVLQAREGFPIVVPWLVVLGLVVATTALAALVAAVFTRSRLITTMRQP